jgi:hypothetical protein
MLTELYVEEKDKMRTVRKLLSNAWAWVGAAFTVVVTLLLFSNSRRKAAESKLLNAEVSADSRVLDERKANNDSRIEDLSKEAGIKKAEVVNDTTEDLANWFKKRY